MKINDKNNKIITRFAPSPTGFLHIGGARTALYSFLYAKQNKGQFILRIEDTDKERSKEEHTAEIISGMKWLGLDWDNEKIIKQSERGEVYKKYLQSLIEEGKAYISKEEPKEVGQRSEVIRFKNPNKKVSFEDMIRGEIQFDTTELGDFVIAKSIDEPIFHLAVVVDDFESGITHIIRGEDHISNTPRQILIQEAIGAPRPIYAHLPLILSEKKEKLSKRKHGEMVSVQYYKDNGYLSDAFINFIALLGWNPGDDRELLTKEELLRDFNVGKIQKSGAVFNVEKLRWFNKEYLNQLSDEVFFEKAIACIPELKTIPSNSREIFIKSLRERISVFSDLKIMKETGDLEYFFSAPKIQTEKLLWHKNPNKENVKKHLQFVKNEFEKIKDENWNLLSVKESILEYAEKEGKGDVLWPLRMALSGKDKSPDPFTLACIFGKKETVFRIEEALKNI